MIEIWERLEAVLQEREPRLLTRLNPGATVEAIEAVEQETGLTFPADLRAAYLRHDGTSSDAPQFFAYGFRWATLEQLTRTWRGLVANGEALRASDPDCYPEEDESWADLAVKPFYYHAAWVPVGLSNTEDLLLCDVDPAPRGRVGQLIRASGLGDFRATDAGFNAYAARFAELLAKGMIRWNDGQWFEVASGQPMSSTTWAALHGDEPFR